MRTRLLREQKQLQDAHRGRSNIQLGRRSFLMGLGLVAGAGLLTACSSDQKTESRADEADLLSAGPEGSPAILDINSDNFSELTAALTQMADDAGYQLTLSLYEYPTDEFSQGVQYNFHPEYVSYEASLSKVPIALSVLRKLHAESAELDEQTRALLEASLGQSDNASTQTLFTSLGEDSASQAAYLNETYSLLGIQTTRSEGDWGVNVTSTEDQVLLVRAVDTGVDWVNSADLETVRKIMLATDESQTWGVGGASEELGADYVLCKNGWIQDDTVWLWYINTMGIVELNGRRYAVSSLNYGNESQAAGQELATQAVVTALRHFSQ